MKCSDTGLLPKMVLGYFCYFGNLQHSRERPFDILKHGWGKGTWSKTRQQQHFGWPLGPLRPRVSPKLKPKEVRVSWRKQKKAPGWGALWESVHLQHMLETAQNKQVKIKPQKDSQSQCLKFLQTGAYCVTIVKVWEIDSFVVYPTTIQPIISVTASPPAETQLVNT